jgi:hypothetical protein
MYDLLTKDPRTGITGLIIIDNQILVERFQKNFPVIDRAIYWAFNPLLDLRNYPGEKGDVLAMSRVFVDVDEPEDQEERSSSIFSQTERNLIEGREESIKQPNLLPPILVPCYHFRKGQSGSADSLVDAALGQKNRLFPCQPTRAERAYVFIRGFFRSEDVNEAVLAGTGLHKDKINVFRKIGDGRFEDVLILLRNPYGGSPGAHKDKEAFEGRIYDIINEALKFMETNQKNILETMGYTDFTKEHLRNYFYGKGGLKWELLRSLERLELGKKPLFTRPLSIFKDSTAISQVPKMVEIEKERLKDLMNIGLKEMLNSEECESKIRDIVESQLSKYHGKINKGKEI